jgi:23S rRNA pseudouridine1911/1915/1917 synthase
VIDLLNTFIYQSEQSQRLDKYLVTCFPEFSRNRVQNLIKAGQVSVNSITISKPGYTLQVQDVVDISIPPNLPSNLIPEDIFLDIVFENGDLIVVNKPAGMVVHPSAGHDSGTLVHAALSHAPEMVGIGGEQRPGVVHRLDKNTSGLILLAKNDLSHRWLQNQFSQRKVNKLYTALVDGYPPTPTGRIEAPIGRDPGNRKKMAVVTTKKGRSAVSEYNTLETYHEHTLLEIHPITGRTHQIRLHMLFLGCPIAADTIYGKRQPSLPLDRHFLHATQIDIRLPGKEQPSTFRVPLPKELEDILVELRKST